MHVDLIEALRCPNAHEESWLVARFDRMAGRQVAEGTLGCPVCRAEFPIVGGAVRFDRGGAGESAGHPAGAGWPEGAGGEAGALRLAALLGLGEGTGVVVLAGAWSAWRAAIAALVPDFQLLLLNPPVAAAVPEEVGEPPSVLVSPGRLPVAAGAVRAVAVDEGNATPALLADAVRALAAGGRLVAPAATALPDGVGELARDEALWVAERREAPRLVPLGRGAGPG